MPDEKEEKKDDEKKDLILLPVDDEPVVTHHTIDIGGNPFHYTATAGMMPLRDETGELEAGIFYIAYRKARDPNSKPEPLNLNRPLMFSFNGGPGSSSVWLHLGAVGPKRVKLLEEGHLPAPPFVLEDNPYTWLEHVDLCFIDPVGTGYSRPAKKDGGDKYWGVKGDIESMGEFIRLFLTRFERWSSPLFLVGESYGTTRAAGLSGHLIEKGIAFNGIVLVSSILNLQTARFAKGNDLPFVLFLPTYTATAWFHKKLSKPLLRSLPSTLRRVEAFASGEYALALAKGHDLKPRERTAVIRKLSQFTGLRPEYVDQTDLRINIHMFCKELMRDEKRTVGRLDSRFKGIDANAAEARPEVDPSMTGILPPYTATLNDYIRRVLGFKTDLTYRIFAEGKLHEKWDWGKAAEGYPDTSEALRTAITRNPYMKVFVANGYYDLATPYFATQYTLAHLGLDPSLKENLSTGYYEAGHMMYIHTGELVRLKHDVSDFLASAL